MKKKIPHIIVTVVFALLATLAGFLIGRISCRNMLEEQLLLHVTLSEDLVLTDFDALNKKSGDYEVTIPAGSKGSLACFIGYDLASDYKKDCSFQVDFWKDGKMYTALACRNTEDMQYTNAFAFSKLESSQDVERKIEEAAKKYHAKCLVRLIAGPVIGLVVSVLVTGMVFSGINQKR